MRAALTCAVLAPPFAGALAGSHIVGIEREYGSASADVHSQQYPGSPGVNSQLVGGRNQPVSGDYGGVYPAQGFLVQQLPPGGDGDVQPQPQPSQGGQQEEELAAPISPGCYLWLPEGCPRQPHFKAETWKKDNSKFWMDPKNLDAEYEGKCLGERKESLVSWCGTQSVHMLFQTGDNVEPNIPDLPGCYVLSTKCPSQPWYSARGWNFNWQLGPSNPEGCFGARLTLFQKWCGNPKAVALWVNPPPKAPGCFIWLPNGCPRNPKFTAPSWKKDSWPGWTDGRVAADQASQETFCLEDRRAKLREWCNTERVGTSYNRCDPAVDCPTLKVPPAQQLVAPRITAAGRPAAGPLLSGPPAAGPQTIGPPGPPAAGRAVAARPFVAGPPAGAAAGPP